MSTAGGQDQEGTDTVPSWVTLPDDLMGAAELDDMPENWDIRELMRQASERISDLEEEVLALRKQVQWFRGAILGHRGAKDFNGAKDSTDYRLWEVVEDVPWGKPIKGDG